MVPSRHPERRYVVILFSATVHVYILIDLFQIDGKLNSGGVPGGEGVLANFFNSLLNKKAGAPGGSPNAPGASPRSMNGTVDISDKTAMRSDAAAELDRLTRNVKKEMDFTQTDC